MSTKRKESRTKKSAADPADPVEKSAADPADPDKKSAADPADPDKKSDTIRFRATLESIGARTILRLPEAASTALPSRGQVAVRGTFAGKTFETVIEPDGDFGHWMNVDAELLGRPGQRPTKLRDAAHVEVGAEVTVEITPTKDWPEPVVPPDFADALSAAPSDVQSLWRAITPMARWEWVRWVN